MMYQWNILKKGFFKACNADLMKFSLTLMKGFSWRLKTPTFSVRKTFFFHVRVLQQKTRVLLSYVLGTQKTIRNFPLVPWRPLSIGTHWSLAALLSVPLHQGLQSPSLCRCVHWRWDCAQEGCSFAPLPNHQNHVGWLIRSSGPIIS